MKDLKTDQEFQDWCGGIDRTVRNADSPAVLDAWLDAGQAAVDEINTRRRRS